MLLNLAHYYVCEQIKPDGDTVIKRIIKQQQGIERFDYDYLAGLPSKPKRKMSVDEWRREARERRIVDLETALEPGDKSRFPGLPSTPTQGILVEIMTAIRALEAKVDHLTDSG